MHCAQSFRDYGGVFSELSKTNASPCVVLDAVISLSVTPSVQVTAALHQSSGLIDASAWKPAELKIENSFRSVKGKDGKVNH